MDDIDRRAHWERIYTTKSEGETSWFQQVPARSLELIEEAGVRSNSEVIDVGGGDSTLVDALLDRNWGHVTVLDISAAALAGAQERLGPRAREVTWIEGDVTRASLPANGYDIWHDRATFHFLTNAGDRERYVHTMHRSVKSGGHVVIATFAEDGPPRCSGLDVVRYDPVRLHSEMGAECDPLRSLGDSHRTPFGIDQRFTYCHFRRR